MEQLGISQSSLAQLISQARGDGKTVERVTINRALNHAGADAPIMQEILSILRLELRINATEVFMVFFPNLDGRIGSVVCSSMEEAKTFLESKIGPLEEADATNGPSGQTWHFQNDGAILHPFVLNMDDVPDIK